MNLYYKKVLIISDNSYLCNEFIKVCEELHIPIEMFSFAWSFFSPNEIKLDKNINTFPINVKNEWEQIANDYDLVFSIHCKQLFPKKMINKVKCINLHPGLNPYNRGWFPQVFSIVNKMPLGATLHEIDEKLDNGDIIDQEEVDLFSFDTSLTAYNRVVENEIRILRRSLLNVLQNNYTKYKPRITGNVNLKSDFNKLCALNLDKKQTIGETIDLLRALSHGDYNNAFFIDENTQEKIFVNINFIKD